MASSINFAIALLAASLLAAPRSAEALLQSPITDWLDMLQDHVRATPYINHQQAALFFSGLGMSMHNVLRCSRGNTWKGTPAVDDKIAIAYAAHAYMNTIYPSYFMHHDRLIMQQLEGFDDADRLSARAFGENETQKVIVKRVSDGYQRFAQFPLPGRQDGVYRMTPGQTFLMMPQLQDLTPFTLPKSKCAAIAEQFVGKLRNYGGPGVHYLKTAQYITELNNVEFLGNMTSPLRTGYDAQTPGFWNDGLGTATAVGHFLNISYQVLHKDLSLLEQAKAFAKLLTAMSDASIPCWKVKYTALLWRPWTAITEGTAVYNADGTVAFTPDPYWRPLLSQPPHPSYPSGHSCIGGAATKMLELLTGSDSTNVVIGSESLPEAGRRTFTAFSDMVKESGRSRVLGGLHYQNDCDAGMELGRQVALGVLDWFAADALL